MYFVQLKPLLKKIINLFLLCAVDVTDDLDLFFILYFLHLLLYAKTVYCLSEYLIYLTNI